MSWVLCHRVSNLFLSRIRARMEGDICKEFEEVVLRGMACLAAELIVSVGC
jgi:hypothetical protein